MDNLDNLLYDCLILTTCSVFNTEAPQNQSIPYAVFSTVADTKTNTAQGQCVYKDVRYQINIYDENVDKVNAIMADMETKLLDNLYFSAIIYQTFKVPVGDGTINGIMDIKLNKRG